MEAEPVLFDPSTNPSLDARAHHAESVGWPPDAHLPQRGVAIPEEDVQAA